MFGFVGRLLGFNNPEPGLTFDQKMDWVNDLAEILRENAGSEIEKVKISEKIMLFRRGLRHGTIFFIRDDFPSTHVPLWYLESAIGTRPLDRERAEEAIEERQAFFYLMNEIKGLRKKYFLDES